MNASTGEATLREAADEIRRHPRARAESSTSRRAHERLGGATMIVGMASALGLAACGDVLGLHDLKQGDVDALDASASMGEEDGAPNLDPTARRPEDLDGAVDSPSPTGSSGPPSTGADASSPPRTQAPDATPPSTNVPDASASNDPCACGCTTHSNGLGQTFKDCAPAGTHDAAEALAACAASTGNASACAVSTCTASSGGAGKTTVQAACSTANGTCSCWWFAGRNVGDVRVIGGTRCDPCASGSGNVAQSGTWR